MNTIDLLVGNQIFKFQECVINGQWNPVPLVYMFHVKWAVAGVHTVVPYIGETGDATSRFPGHDYWDEAVRDYGATHVLACVAPAATEKRRAWERTLIQAFNPPMNTKHKPKGIAGALPTNAPPRGLINSGGVAGVGALGGGLLSPAPTLNSLLADALRDTPPAPPTSILGDYLANYSGGGILGGLNALGALSRKR